MTQHVTYTTRAVNALYEELAGRGMACDPGLVRMYALLVLTRGESVVPRDVHNAWLLYMDGLTSGHPGVVPFEELTDHVKKEISSLAEAVRSAAARLL